MAAAPFKATVSFVDETGLPVATYALSASDVANAFLTNDADGLTFIDLPSRKADGRPLGAVYMDDAFLSAAVTDTTQLEVWAGGMPTIHRLRNSQLASAANVKRAPRLGFQPGRR